MAANEILSPRQFMSVKELGNYQSNDRPEKTMNQVHQMIRRGMLRDDRLNYRQRVLQNSIREEGIRDPVEVDPVNHIYGQGHHRFSAARSLRLKEIPVIYRDMGS